MPLMISVQDYTYRGLAREPLGQATSAPPRRGLRLVRQSTAGNVVMKQ